jgi:rod shape-determining protein MreD
MKLPALPPLGAERYRRRINRAPSRRVGIAVPWASIALTSMAGFSPIIASAPVLPPLALMLLIAWRVARPGLLPVWAGLPLGAIDDLYSGQPFGSAVLIWSAAMIVMELIDQRFLWRGFAEDWLAAGSVLTGALLVGAVIAGAAARHQAVWVALPQIVLAALLYPAMTAVVALLDRLRLLPVKVRAGGELA